MLHILVTSRRNSNRQQQPKGHTNVNNTYLCHLLGNRQSYLLQLEDVLHVVGVLLLEYLVLPAEVAQFLEFLLVRLNRSLGLTRALAHLSQDVHLTQSQYIMVGLTHAGPSLAGRPPDSHKTV